MGEQNTILTTLKKSHVNSLYSSSVLEGDKIDNTMFVEQEEEILVEENVHLWNIS